MVKTTDATVQPQPLGRHIGNEVALQWAEMRMVRWMCGVKLEEKSSK